jgi:hypothetical protein
MPKNRILGEGFSRAGLPLVPHSRDPFGNLRGPNLRDVRATINHVTYSVISGQVRPCSVISVISVYLVHPWYDGAATCGVSLRLTCFFPHPPSFFVANSCLTEDTCVGDLGV